MADRPSAAGILVNRRKKWRRFSLGFGALLFLAVFGYVIPVPAILLLRVRDPGSTAFIEARKDRLEKEGKPARIDRRPVPLSRVSPHLIRAVITAEDARFFTHRGIDPDAIAKAREYNKKQEARGKKRRLGASTITQQLAKNLYLSPERSMFRKAREAAIAITMELVLGKARILEIYLSAIEWGETTYGCEAAARKYFGIPASQLNPAQSARLAAMIPSPARFARDPARLAARAEKIAARARREKPSLEPLEDEELSDEER